MADYPANSASPQYFASPKDPSSVVDYAFDISEELQIHSPDDAIDSYTVTVDPGLTKDSDSQAGGVITFWVSGGTAGREYGAELEAVTTGGRTHVRTGIIRVRNR